MNAEFQTMELNGETVTYSVLDVIKGNNEVANRWRDEPDYREALKSRGVQRVVRLDPKADVYPYKQSYTFQEFAGPVFEIGGYGDMTLIDPYTLKRLWVGGVFVDDNTSVYDGIRRVLAVAEELDFLGSEGPDPKSPTASGDYTGGDR